MPSTITLSHPTAGAGGTPIVLDLPPDLLWTDEFAWSQVLQTREYSSTGALHIGEWTKQAGRPMTLQGSVDYAWCQRAELLTAKAWENQAGLAMVLVHNGENYLVAWNRESGSAITAEPIVPYSDPLPTDPYSLTLRFLQLSAP
jgi:hypothetical protein